MRLGSSQGDGACRPERLPMPMRSAERPAATNQGQNRLSVVDQKLGINEVRTPIRRPPTSTVRMRCIPMYDKESASFDVPPSLSEGETEFSGRGILRQSIFSA